jgi:hypothetical protein
MNLFIAHSPALGRPALRKALRAAIAIPLVVAVAQMVLS